jgi:MOSC domain-containing protein YiiM
MQAHPILAAPTPVPPPGEVQVRRLYVSTGHCYFGRHGQPAADYAIAEVESVECVAGRGLRGDRFFDYRENYQGQVTFFSWETYEAICRELAVTDRSPAVFRRNVLTAGIDLAALIGHDFEVQGVAFHGLEECRPCYWMEQAFAPGAHAYLKGRGGLRAAILGNGILRTDAL